MFTVAKKEISTYFKSPIAYVLIGLFMLMISVLFYTPFSLGSGDFMPVMDSMGFFLIFLVPILTMRILAEDRKNGTEVLLLTSPTSLTKIVVGKFLAMYFIFIIITILSLIYPLIMVAYGAVFTVQLAGAYIGFLLLGAAFISVGVFASAITENQIISAIISFVALLAFWLAGTFSTQVGGDIAKFLNWISLTARYDVFTRGLLGLPEIAYFVFFTILFIFLTVRVIERRRWIQG
ncbi:MAG TPA: ABC transporter permease [Clostridia bacterium]|nr:ABC transporter permease [Clostridia bacterium]HPQ46297.1 ABC transporter permease [Clostridia bacterium]HRX42888.1 ABC transporter permease [Clostridia bacterium]